MNNEIEEVLVAYGREFGMNVGDVFAFKATEVNLEGDNPTVKFTPMLLVKAKPEGASGEQS